MITEIGQLLTPSRRFTCVIAENNLNACKLVPCTRGLPILNQRRYSLATCNDLKMSNFIDRRSSIEVITINNECRANKKRQAFIKKNHNVSFESHNNLILPKNNHHAIRSKIKIISEPSITNISKSVINLNIKKYTKIRRRSKCCIENIQHNLFKRNFSF
jgi:hypothetical protein